MGGNFCARCGTMFSRDQRTNVKGILFFLTSQYSPSEAAMHTQRVERRKLRNFIRSAESETILPAEEETVSIPWDIEIQPREKHEYPFVCAGCGHVETDHENRKCPFCGQNNWIRKQTD